MPPMPQKRRVFAIVLAVLIAYEAYAFFVKEAGQSENFASKGDWHLTGEVAGDAALVQTLITHADGFDGLDIWAHAASPTATPRGPVVVTIFHGETGTDPANPATVVPEDYRVARVSIPASQVVAAQPFHVSFPRIDASAGRPFIIHISAPEATRGQGIRLEASGPTYPQGAMTLGGREEWGDLQFRTTAERTTIYRNVRHLRQSAALPAIVRSDVFLVVMLVLFNAALAALLYDVVLADADQR
jgi:hypothetical protein